MRSTFRRDTADPVSCIICGEEFAPLSPRHICCSPECRRERRRRTAQQWYAVPRNRKRHIRKVIAARQK